MRKFGLRWLGSVLGWASVSFAATPTGHSFAPVIGYEPTYRLVAGAAYFYRDQALGLGVVSNTNGGGVYQVHANAHRASEDLEAQLLGSVVQGFQPYYGEGGATRPSDFREIWGRVVQAKVELGHAVAPGWTVGGLATLRTADLDRRESAATSPRPDEATPGVGVFHRLDRRDDPTDPHRGFLWRQDLVWAPGGGFLQTEAEFSFYQPLFATHTRRLTLAVQLAGGTSFGSPTFLYAFTLGGARRLRGFHENRFRGAAYYLEQTEVRFPIAGAFSGAVFVGAGDVGERFTGPKLSGGGGVRIVLPPDWVSRVRIDFAASADQHGLFADFGHAF